MGLGHTSDRGGEDTSAFCQTQSPFLTVNGFHGLQQTGCSQSSKSDPHIPKQQESGLRDRIQVGSGNMTFSLQAAHRLHNQNKTEHNS